jgi:hypothetical protein
MALQGSLSDFPLEQVLRLLEATRKTGTLEVRGKQDRGSLEVSKGSLTAAHCGEDGGEAALGAIVAMQDGDFTFRSGSVGASNLSGTLDTLMGRALEEGSRLESIRQEIPTDHMRFRLSERAASGGPITVTAEQWRVLLAVDGQRDVRAIAAQSKTGRLATLRHLQALLAEGLVDVAEAGTEDRAAQSRSWAGPVVEDVAEPDWQPEPEPRPIAEEPRWGQTWPEPAAADRSQPRGAPFPSAGVQPAAPAAPPIARPPSPPPPPAPAAAAPAPAPVAPAQPTAPPPPRQDVWQIPAEEPAPALDERLAALSGSPPAFEAPAGGRRSQTPDDFWRARIAEQEASATPPAPQPAPPSATEKKDVDDRLAALFGGAAPAAPPGADPSLQAPRPPRADVPELHYLPPDATAPILEAEAPQVVREDKKKGLFGLFGAQKPKSPTESIPTSFLSPAATAASSPGRLAAFANALLTEYNSGQYGKGKLDERMAVRLRIVDEQADPIDRPLPVSEDRLDVGAIDQQGAATSAQIAPYLAVLVRQIYDDAERTFGKDRAKRGYRAAVQNALGGDESSLRDPAIAERLPRI